MRKDKRRRDNRAFWTQHEDELLRSCKAQGMRYTEMVRHFAMHGYDRTDQSLGNRYQQLRRLDEKHNRQRDAEMQRLAVSVPWVRSATVAALQTANSEDLRQRRVFVPSKDASEARVSDSEIDDILKSLFISLCLQQPGVRRAEWVDEDGVPK